MRLKPCNFFKSPLWRPLLPQFVAKSVLDLLKTFYKFCMTTTKSTESDFRIWLQSELIQRCKRNPRYSLRSFATLLDLDASSVSQMISGKRKASPAMINKICSKLSADPIMKERFMSLAKVRKMKLGEISAAKDYSRVSVDALEVISNWQYFAILELMNTKGFKSQPQWIASSLHITVPEVNVALDRLIRLGLVEENDGEYTRTPKFLSAYAPGETSHARKELQKQVLRMALEAIDNVPIESRDMTNMTMAIDPARIPEARELITKFRRDLCTFLETGEQTQVYQLGIQLYPLSNDQGIES